jgi:hypothetical protein
VSDERTHDDWLLGLDPKTRRAEQRAAEAHEEPEPPAIPDADQGHLGPAPSATPKPRAKDDWLLDLMDDQGTKTYGD